MENGTISRLELVQVADAVAREKNIDRQVVLDAMAEAIQRAARSRYGAENDIKAEIDGKSGEINLYRCLEVVELVENENTEINIETAKLHNPDATIGDILADRLPPIDFGRIAAQAAKQVIVQKVRDAERDQQFEEFKDRVGEMIHGLIKRVLNMVTLMLILAAQRHICAVMKSYRVRRCAAVIGCVRTSWMCDGKIVAHKFF